MNITQLMSDAGRSFLRAFAASLIVLAPGVLAAPNLDGAKLLGIAGLVASLASGLRAIQSFVPALQFGPGHIGDLAGSFTRAFLGSFIVSIVGILSAPELNFGRSLVTGAITGAIAAGFVALQKQLDGGSVGVVNTAKPVKPKP